MEKIFHYLCRLWINGFTIIEGVGSPDLGNADASAGSRFSNREPGDEEGILRCVDAACFYIGTQVEDAAGSICGSVIKNFHALLLREAA
jgi:hypothetical protein